MLAVRGDAVWGMQRVDAAMRGVVLKAPTNL